MAAVPCPEVVTPPPPTSAAEDDISSRAGVSGSGAYKNDGSEETENDGNKHAASRGGEGASSLSAGMEDNNIEVATAATSKSSSSAQVEVGSINRTISRMSESIPSNPTSAVPETNPQERQLNMPRNAKGTGGEPPPSTAGAKRDFSHYLYLQGGGNNMLPAPSIFGNNYSLSTFALARPGPAWHTVNYQYNISASAQARRLQITQQYSVSAFTPGWLASAQHMSQQYRYSHRLPVVNPVVNPVVQSHQAKDGKSNKQQARQKRTCSLCNTFHGVYSDLCPGGFDRRNCLFFGVDGQRKLCQQCKNSDCDGGKFRGGELCRLGGGKQIRIVEELDLVGPFMSSSGKLPPPPPLDNITLPNSKTCKWSVDCKRRIVTADFSGVCNQVSKMDLEFLLQMFERTDIAVITIGLAKNTAISLPDGSSEQRYDHFLKTFKMATEYQSMANINLKDGMVKELVKDDGTWVPSTESFPTLDDALNHQANCKEGCCKEGGKENRIIVSFILTCINII